MPPLWYFLQWYASPFIMIGVSAAYFFADRRRPAYGSRLLSSAHGLIGAMLYFGALELWAMSPTYRPWLGWPYAALFLIPLSLIVVSFLKFQGPKLVHVLQIPNVLALFWACGVGGMAATGDWL